MNAERIGALLTAPAAVTLLPETDSTNTQLKRLAGQGAPNGTALIAVRQTGGRGRSGKRFASPEGGLYLSVLLRPAPAADALNALTPAAALAVCAAAERVCGLRLSVKWVNDLIFDGRKLGGILTELEFSPDGTPRCVLIGVGLNAARQSFAPELAGIAGTLEDAVGAPVDRNALAAAVISELMKVPELLRSPDCRARYAERCVTVGRQVRVLQGSNCFTGLALGIGEDYSLIVRRGADGVIERVSAGEVSVRGIAGYAE